MHSSLQIVALPLKILVIELHHLDIDTARSHINEFVRGVLVLDDVSVGRALLHPDQQTVHASRQGVASA